MPPGQTVFHPLGIDGFLDKHRQHLRLDPLLKSNGLSILAVRFADGTGDGDPIHLEQISEYRSGVRDLVQRTLSILENTRTLHESDQTVELERLKSSLRIPSTVNRLERSYSRFSLTDTSAVLRYEIERMAKGPGLARQKQITACI